MKPTACRANNARRYDRRSPATRSAMASYWLSGIPRLACSLVHHSQMEKSGWTASDLTVHTNRDMLPSAGYCIYTGALALSTKSRKTSVDKNGSLARVLMTVTVELRVHVRQLRA